MPSFISKKDLSVIIFLLLAFWVLIYKSLSSINFMSHDWYLAYQLIDFTRSTLLQTEILPYIGLYNPTTGTHELFGHHTYSIGMLIFSPDSIFFPLFSTHLAILFHIFVTAAFACYLLIVQMTKYSLSLLSKSFLLLNVIFAIPIMARISEGHLQLLGYFLVPSFILLMNNFSSQENSKVWVLKVTFLLTYIISLGSTHVFFQMSLLLCCFGLFHTRVFFRFLIPPVFALLLTGFQSIPSLFTPFFERRREVGPGYGYQFDENILGKDSYYSLDSFSDLLITSFRHFIEILNHLFFAIFENEFAIQKSGWEWTLYSPPTNIILLVLLIIYKKHVVRLFVKDHLYLVISALMSISLIYHFIWEQIPFQAVDRVPYRMMLYPFFGILILVTFHLDDLMSVIANRSLRIWLKVSILMSSLLGLLLSSLKWFDRLSEVTAVSVLKNGDVLPKFQIFTAEVSPEYDKMLSIGFVVTFMSWISITLFIVSISKRVRNKLPTKLLSQLYRR